MIWAKAEDVDVGKCGHCGELKHFKSQCNKCEKPVCYTCEEIKKPCPKIKAKR